MPTGKVYFTDANTGAAINSILVIPEYYEMSATGIGFLKGEEVVSGAGISGGYSGYVYAYPFISYSSDLEFIIEQPAPGAAIVIPGVAGAVTGKDLDLKGTVVIAKGYEPKYIEVRFFMENYLRPLNFKLEPIDANKSKEVLTKLSNGIRNKDCEVFWCNEYYPVLPKDWNLKCEFSEEEWKMIEDFVFECRNESDRQINSFTNKKN